MQQTPEILCANKKTSAVSLNKYVLMTEFSFGDTVSRKTSYISSDPSTDPQSKTISLTALEQQIPVILSIFHKTATD